MSDGTISNVVRTRVGAPAGAFLLHLMREWLFPDGTFGKLFVDGVWVWFTLEDTLRAPGVKIPGETCIPAGAYRVIMTYSPKFKRMMPLLVNVPGFTDIRIHPANTVVDVRGCIGVGGGFDQAQKKLTHSRVAADDVTATIAQQIKAGKDVWIEIIDPPPSTSIN